MNHLFRPFVAALMILCFSCSSMVGPSVTVRHGIGPAGQPHIPDLTAEQFKECGELVQEGLKPGLIPIDARIEVDRNGQVLEATTKGEPNPEVGMCLRLALRDMHVDREVIEQAKRRATLSSAPKVSTIANRVHAGQVVEIITEGDRGMQFDRVNPFGATSPEAIAEFEARWQVTLPLEYKQFLLNANGGWPTPDVFEVPGWHGKGNSLDAFYGLHDGRKSERLDGAMDSYDERIPGDLIPIGFDANGNAICIGWKGKREGKIYFWDHEDELDENGEFVQDYRNVFLLADSLQEFLDSLMTSEELEKRPRTKRR